MVNCRMCERKIPGEYIPIDGLCSQCHLSLCDKGIGKCVRCAKIVDNMVSFLYPEKYSDGEEKDD